MLFTNAILAAILVSLALTTLAAAVGLLRARRALAVPAVAGVESRHARDQRLVAALVQVRSAAGGVHSGAERALWAMSRFDDRAERLEMAMIGRREQMEQARQQMMGLGGKLDRLRSIARLVIG